MIHSEDNMSNPHTEERDIPGQEEGGKPNPFSNEGDVDGRKGRMSHARVPFPFSLSLFDFFDSELRT